MLQIYPDEGLIPILKAIVGNGSAGLTWALYSNNITPDYDSEFADFIVPAGGWAERILHVADFTFEQVALHVGTLQAPSITFTNNTGSSKSVYGYIVYDQVAQKIRAAARFDSAPIAIANTGTIKVQALIGDSSNQLDLSIDGGTF
jgi:hypothetical protein